ncbi:MAG: flagellar hook-associated protein FlgK [Moorellales bacterium]
MSLFFALSIARRALSAQQAAMNTAGHNIANANTEGYSRQRAVMQTTAPWPVPSVSMPAGAGQIGTGVEVALIQRIRDTFLDRQIRNELATLGLWEQRRDTLQQVEVVFMEPGETGLSTLLSQFWDAWQELSKYPESMPVRTTVIETAQSLAEALRHTHQQLTNLRSDLNDLIALKVEEINTLARQIADLNQQIFTITVAGISPNDLLDRRDLLLDQLSKIVAITVEPVTIDRGSQTVDTGAVRVKLREAQVSGTPVELVGWDEGRSSARVEGLEARSGTDGYEVYWLGDTSAPVPQQDLGGELTGLFYARDDVLLHEYLDQLDRFAQALAAGVNNQHQGGFDYNGIEGGAFFVDDEGGTVTSGGAIYVNPALVADVSKVAAAGSRESDGSPIVGDGTNALAIAQLRREPVSDLDGFTFDDYYKNLIARLGVASNEAQRMVENQNVLVEQLNQRKESISGVSLDEEMVNLIQYQYAYQAAARVITVVDEMLDTLINRMLR